MRLDNPTVGRRLQMCRVIANEAGYEEIDWQDNIGMVSFQKVVAGQPVRHNVYLTKMTVATALKHPKQGPTQIYLRNASFGDIRNLFNRPRFHTGRRYHRRRK